MAAKEKSSRIRYEEEEVERGGGGGGNEGEVEQMLHVRGGPGASCHLALCFL